MTPLSPNPRNMLQHYRKQCFDLMLTVTSSKACWPLSFILYPPYTSNGLTVRICNHRYTVLRPRFSTQILGEKARVMGYQSSAILPNNSPVRIAQGQIQRTKALAQASASLEACKQLHQVGILPACLSICLSVRPSVRLSVCLSVCLVLMLRQAGCNQAAYPLPNLVVSLMCAMQVPVLLS